MLGFFLVQQIASNLLLNAEEAAYTQGSNGLASAQADPDVFKQPGIASESLMSGLISNLKASSLSPGADYGVAITPLRGPPTYWGGADNGLLVANLPGGLVAEVDHVPGMSPKMVHWRMRYPRSGSQETPGLVYAAQVSNYYGLYYFFPLTQVQDEVVRVERLVVLVGLALVFLLAGIAWLVTRWVVVPVARAAQGAQLLSTGKLDERLEVHGDDEVAALATSFNDMAASLQEKMRELEELSQVQRQFVSDVSHELRTPLTTIRMAADLLFESRLQLDASAARSAELLQGQLGRFESLLADLLEISRYDANAATLEAEVADVCDVVRHSADVAQHLAERRGSRIEFRLPAEPCVAEMDRRRVERILRNLLVAIAVRDFGVGLEPGEEHLVFDRFWRADPARARTTGGTGLGLAIALEDARLHGGWLEAWGQPGRGSVFRLTLPREAGAALIGSPLPLSPDQIVFDGVIPARSSEQRLPDLPATQEKEAAAPTAPAKERP